MKNNFINFSNGMLSLKDLHERGVIKFQKRAGGFYSNENWKLMTVIKYNEKMIKLECSSGKNITLKSDNQKLLDQIFEILNGEFNRGQSLESILTQKLFTLI